MGISDFNLSNFVSFLRSNVAKQDEATSKFKGFFSATRKQPPERDTKQWLEMFTTSPRLSPIAKVCKDVATTKGTVVKITDNGKEKVIKHELTDLLYKPNNEYNITGMASLFLSQVYYLLKGESFGVVERDARGKPKFIWFVPPHWVTLPGSDDNDSGSYKLTLPNHEIGYVKKEDMFYRKNPNPVNPMGRGAGVVESLGDEIETDEYMSKFAKRFFYNDATPNIVITAPEDADDEEINKVEKKWYQKFGGYLNNSKTAFLNWDAKVHVLNTSNREMDFIESRKFYRDLAIQHLGIPPEIMGNVENSNKATVVAARDIYHNEVLEPMFKEFEQAITWQLLKLYDNSEDLEFRFQRRKIDEEQFIFKVLKESADEGKITLREYRRGISELLDYELEDIGNGYDDTLYVPTNKILINIKEPLKDQQNNNQPDEEDDSDNGDEQGGNENDE